VIHCSALPESLLEQELAGRDGTRSAFSRAAGGTLVLEEVDVLGPRLQAILHDQLEAGPGKPYRVIATTTRPLDVMARKGEFRSDLFYRLAVIPVAVPPLRERTDDILPLAEYFLHELARTVPGVPGTIEKDARKLLQKYPWPGNVGELRNAIQRACALATGEEITVMDLPSRLRQANPSLAPVRSLADEDDAALPIGTSLGKFIRDQERKFIKATLTSVAGNKEQAAGILDISLATLYRKLDE
jgi:DNA-binding NtrC family response regulator